MTDDKLVSLLMTGPKTLEELAIAGGETVKETRTALTRLSKQNKVTHVYETVSKYKLTHVLIRPNYFITKLTWAVVIGALLGSLVTHLAVMM